MEKELTFNEIVAACCGTDEHGAPNSTCLMTSFINADGNNDIVAEYPLGSGMVRIFMIRGILTLDFVFTDRFSADMQTMASVLDTYSGKQSNGEDYHIKCAILPAEYAGRYYLLAQDPFAWSMQLEQTTDSEERVIRMFFSLESIQAVDNGEAVDLDEMAEKIAQEMDSKEAFYEAAAEK